MSLSAVLDDRNALLSCMANNLIHVAANAVHVDHDDCLDGRCDRSRQRSRRNVVGIRINVDETGIAPISSGANAVAAQV